VAVVSAPTKRGGKRTGSGRKRRAPTATLALRLPAALVAAYRAASEEQRRKAREAAEAALQAALD